MPLLIIERRRRQGIDLLAEAVRHKAVVLLNGSWLIAKVPNGITSVLKI